MDTQKIIVSGIHVSLTDSLKSIVNSKVQKLFNHDDKIMRISVHLDYDQNKSKSGEFVAHGEIDVCGRNLIARAASDDLYKSIDAMIGKLNRQLVDKTKIDNDKKIKAMDISQSTALDSI